MSVRSPVFRFVIFLGISRPDVKRFLVLLLFKKYFSFSCPTVRSPLRLFATVGILKLLFKGFFSKIEIVPFLGFSSFHLLILNFFWFSRHSFYLNVNYFLYNLFFFLEIVKHSEICYYIMTTPLSKNTFHYKPSLWLFLLRITRRIPCEELQMLSWPTGWLPLVTYNSPAVLDRSVRS